MAKRLITTVHVIERDDKGNETNRGVFGPDDTVPAWAEKAITNPYVWEGAEAEDADPGGGPATPTGGTGKGPTEAPTGTVDEVLAEVGDDPDKAQRALVAERAGKNRTTLIAALEPIARGE